MRFIYTAKKEKNSADFRGAWKRHRWLAVTGASLIMAALLSMPATAEDIEVDLGGGALVTVHNDSDLEITEAELVWESTSQQRLVLTDKDQKEHIFEQVSASGLSDAVIDQEGEHLFLAFTGSIGNTQVVYEKGSGEIPFEEAEEYYLIDTAYIREEPSGDAKAVGVAERGSAVTVTGANENWLKVKQGEVSGYIAASNLSASKEDGEKAVATNEAVRKAQEAAAAAAAAQAAANAAGNGGGGKREVSRERVDDCDGSGHGYYYITYSDGSTSVQDY